MKGADLALCEHIYLNLSTKAVAESSKSSFNSFQKPSKSASTINAVVPLCLEDGSVSANTT